MDPVENVSVFVNGEEFDKGVPMSPPSLGEDEIANENEACEDVFAKEEVGDGASALGNEGVDSPLGVVGLLCFRPTEVDVGTANCTSSSSCFSFCSLSFLSFSAAWPLVGMACGLVETTNGEDGVGVTAKELRGFRRACGVSTATLDRPLRGTISSALQKGSKNTVRQAYPH